MATEPITINVEAEAAQIYKSASPEERRRLEALLSLQILAASETHPSLREITDDIGRKAQERGLTLEML
jgi:hypothetical protein